MFLEAVKIGWCEGVQPTCRLYYKAAPDWTPDKPCRTTPAFRLVPPASLAGWILATEKGRTCAVVGRKITWMFNSRAACISLTPQLHAGYAHAEPADGKDVVPHETVSGSSCFGGICYGAAT